MAVAEIDVISKLHSCTSIGRNNTRLVRRRLADWKYVQGVTK